MNARDIRNKFLEYFKKQEHVVVPSSSLVPPNDPSVLFTTAGMQQFKEYFLGEKDVEQDFKSRRLTSVQRCFRTSDIDVVGDETHCTFFEMLGNFSFGDYSKDGAIRMAWECLTKSYKIQKHRLWATIFSGDDRSTKDVEAYKLWSSYLPIEHIAEFGRSDNWWGPPGTSGPCGPCSEIHVDRTGKPCERGDACRPNCPCGRFVEIWNLVFMEYYQNEKGQFSDLPAKNIDTGMGLERLIVILQNVESVYDTDLFSPLIEAVMEEKGFGEGGSEPTRIRKARIAADHMKGAVFLIGDGVRFSNKDRGYILRRIFRRALDQFTYPNTSYPRVIDAVIDTYSDVYPELKKQRDTILTICAEEASHFTEHVNQTIQKITRERKKTGSGTSRGHEKQKTLTPEQAFTLFTTHGTPLDRLKREGFSFDERALARLIDEHKKKSRAGVIGKFGGHGLGYSLDASRFDPNDAARITRLHTATHLLHQALRTVLGDHVQQSGSDINPERLRFDFTHPTKLTADELASVENLVNEQIKKDLSVSAQEMDLNQALTSGALSFFKERYPARVTVYRIGDFSKEICGGPHVQHTATIGRFKIISEKSSAAGIRRIKASVTASP